MIYTELAQRRQQFHVASARQQPKSAISTPLPWILIIGAIKRKKEKRKKERKKRKKRGHNHSFRITCDMCAVGLLESKE